jgi:hypothetical protein
VESSSVMAITLYDTDSADHGGRGWRLSGTPHAAFAEMQDAGRLIWTPVNELSVTAVSPQDGRRRILLSEAKVADVAHQIDDGVERFPFIRQGLPDCITRNSGSGPHKPEGEGRLRHHIFLTASV